MALPRAPRAWARSATPARRSNGHPGLIRRMTAKATFSNRSGSSWKWHTTCPGPGYEADGEAVFPDHENYTVKSTSVTKIGDQVRNSRTTITAKWLGADCGGLKPLEPKP